MPKTLEPPLTEAEIVQWLRSRPPDFGISQLKLAYEDRVRRLLRRCHNAVKEQDFDGIINEATLKVFDTIDEFDPRRSTLAGWYWFLANQSAIDWIRKQSRKPSEQPLGDRNPSDEPRLPACIAEDQPISRSSQKRIDVMLAVINKLKGQVRTVALADLNESGKADNATLAAVMGVKPNQVCVLRNKFKRKVMEAFSEHGLCNNLGATNDTQ